MSPYLSNMIGKPSLPVNDKYSASIYITTFSLGIYSK